MTGILRQIDKARQKIKRGVADKLLMQKPFAEGMYRFSMFMIDYYARVRENLKMDYDSFMIVQTAVSHTLYQLNKKKNYGTSYSSLETAWDKIVNRDLELLESVSSYEVNTKNKLTISSVCLITKLPKETVRRKVNQLCSNNLLKISKREGITLGTSYKKVFQNFVPGTTLEVSKLIKLWEKSGVLKGLLSFRI
tara:strand:- start:534 stop:1115 length:582 start_codon:yes stop_codon:yes gene_type:complete